MELLNGNFYWTFCWFRKHALVLCINDSKVKSWNFEECRHWGGWSKHITETDIERFQVTFSFNCTDYLVLEMSTSTNLQLIAGKDLFEPCSLQFGETVTQRSITFFLFSQVLENKCFFSFHFDDVRHLDHGGLFETSDLLKSCGHGPAWPRLWRWSTLRWPHRIDRFAVGELRGLSLPDLKDYILPTNQWVTSFVLKMIKAKIQTDFRIKSSGIDWQSIVAPLHQAWASQEVVYPRPGPGLSMVSTEEFMVWSWEQRWNGPGDHLSIAAWWGRSDRPCLGRLNPRNAEKPIVDAYERMKHSYIIAFSNALRAWHWYDLAWLIWIYWYMIYVTTVHCTSFNVNRATPYFSFDSVAWHWLYFEGWQGQRVSFTLLWRIKSSDDFWHTMVMLEDCNWYDEFIMMFLRFQFSRLNSPSSAIQLFQSDGLELLIPSRLTAQLDWSLFYLFFAVIVKAFEPLWTGSHFKEIFPVLSGWLNPIGSEIIGFLRKTIFCATCEGLLLEHVQEGTQCQSMSNQYIKNQSLPSWRGTTQTLFWKLFVTPTPPSSWFLFRSKNVCMELWVPRWFTDTGNFMELRPASLSSHVFLFQSYHWNCVMFNQEEFIV